MKKKYCFLFLIFNFFYLFAAEPEYLTVLQNGNYVDKWLVNTDTHYYFYSEEKKYNEAGLLTYEKSNSGDEVFYFYDKDNKLIKKEDPYDIYEYDKNEFLIHSINKNTNLEKWYINDDYGNTIYMKDSDGVEYNYKIEVNSKGKLISFESNLTTKNNQYYEDDVTLKYQKVVFYFMKPSRTTESYFDKKGNEIRTTSHIGDKLSYDIFKEYDSNNRVIKEKFNDISKLFEYYNNNLCKTETIIYDDSKIITNFIYDENLKLTSECKISINPYFSSKEEISYNKNGDILSIINEKQPNLDEYYRYDDNNNIVWSRIKGIEQNYINEFDEKGLAIHCVTTLGEEFWYTYDIKPNGFVYCKKTYKEY